MGLTQWGLDRTHTLKTHVQSGPWGFLFRVGTGDFQLEISKKEQGHLTALCLRDVW